MIGSRQSCIQIGQKYARKLFEARGAKKKVSLDEDHLAAVLALAAIEGFELAEKHFKKG